MLRRVLFSFAALLMALPAFASAPEGVAGCRTVDGRTRSHAGDCRSIEMTGVWVVEAWDFNGRRRDAVAGGTAALALPIKKRWTIAFEGTALRVMAPGSADASVIGLSVLGRLHVARLRNVALFLEGGAGPSYASIPVPERGTRFNYLLTGGFGAECLFTKRLGGIVSARLFHLSNGSLNGPQHNPDINALGGHVGIRVRF